MRKIKVLLAVGSFELLSATREAIHDEPQIQIVAQVSNAYEARDKIIEYEPDVVVLANNISRMEGKEFLRKVNAQRPIKTIFLGEPTIEEEAKKAGASFFIPVTQEENTTKAFLLANNINQKILSLVQNMTEDTQTKETSGGIQRHTVGVIAMGASTGGTEAMFQVVKEFDANIPGIVMVQHMPTGFTELYAQRLQRDCKIIAKEAKTGDVVRPGQILLAPAGDKHMRLVKVGQEYQVECKAGPRVSGHRPSVDALFESVARVAGADAIGVLMTGMGRDGAEGLLKMRQAGAKTIGQDEKTSVVYGMPKAAYEIGAVNYQLPLDKIAEKVKGLAYKR